MTNEANFRKMSITHKANESISTRGAIILFDFIVLVVLSVASLYIENVPTIAFFIYGMCRIFLSRVDECIYLLLMLCSNINVFIYSSLPVCNLLVCFAFIRLLFPHKRMIPKTVLMAAFLAAYEFAHLPLYTSFEILQCIVWMLTVCFPVYYFSKVKCYNHSKSKLCFLLGIFSSSIYGCAVRIQSGQGFSVVSFSTFDAARFGAGMHDPNYYSIMCIIAMLLIIEQVIFTQAEDSYLRKVPLWIQSLFLIAMLYFCLAGLSRTFLIVFLFTLFMLIPLVFLMNRSSRKFIAFILMAVVLSVTIINITQYDIIGLFNKTIARFEGAGGDLASVTGGRFDLIAEGIQYLQTHPLALFFGIGVQNYGRRICSVGYIHNAYLELILTLGIVGVIVFLAYVYNLKKAMKPHCSKQIKRVRGCYVKNLPLLIFLVSILSLNSVEVEMFYVLLAFLLMNTLETPTEKART